MLGGSSQSVEAKNQALDLAETLSQDVSEEQFSKVNGCPPWLPHVCTYSEHTHAHTQTCTHAHTNRNLKPYIDIPMKESK